MAHPTDKVNLMDSFQSFPLTEQERAKGHELGELQERVIQNLISQNANDHLQLRYDPQNPYDVALKQEYIRGAIEALQYLLAASHAVKEDSQ